nr:hypothetical protein [uncultured Lichenicoccus sp.]
MLLTLQRPGANPAYPEGWWGWTDQGLYLKSAQAFARGDLAPAQHWYPLGYSLLAAPFVHVLPMHPFLLVDLACFLATFLGFVLFAKTCGFAVPIAVAAFLLGSLGSASIRGSWVIPWTTTPVCTLVWLLLGLCARSLAAPSEETRSARLWRFGLIGVAAGSIPLFRQTDAVLSAIALILLLCWTVKDRRFRLLDWIVLLGGGCVVVVPYAVLYLAIYGPHPSQYMLNSRIIGFRFSLLPFKTVMLLISPRPWFPTGSGLLERLPWIGLGFAGMLLIQSQPAGAPRRGMVMLALMILAYFALFFSYVDLLPSGLWLYRNVHYFKWLFPGLALFGVMFLRELCFGARKTAILAAAGFLLVTGIRMIPVPVAPGEPAQMLQYRAGPLSWPDTYLGQEELADRQGVFTNVQTMRVLPDSQGLRVISISRPFDGQPVWRDLSHLPIQSGAAPREWGLKVTYGWPCWLPPYPCQMLKPNA